MQDNRKQNQGGQPQHGHDQGRMPNRNRTGVQEVPERDMEDERGGQDHQNEGGQREGGGEDQQGNQSHLNHRGRNQGQGNRNPNQRSENRGQ